MSRAGLADRAVFVKSHSARATLTEPVDLVICDQAGDFGFDAGVIQHLADAKRRFLKPGGTLIPARLRLFAAAVESSRCYGPVAGWEKEVVPPPLRWLREDAANTRYPVRLEKTELLGEPVQLGEIDLYAENGALFSWNTSLPIDRAGTLHGVAGWFDCELAEGVWMTNGPLAELGILRSQAFLPLGEPVGVRAGERLAVTVMARPRDEIIAWRWTRRPAALSGTQPGRAYRSPRKHSLGRTQPA